MDLDSRPGVPACPIDRKSCAREPFFRQTRFPAIGRSEDRESPGVAEAYLDACRPDVTVWQRSTPSARARPPPYFLRKILGRESRFGFKMANALVSRDAPSHRRASSDFSEVWRQVASAAAAGSRHRPDRHRLGSGQVELGIPNARRVKPRLARRSKIAVPHGLPGGSRSGRPPWTCSSTDISTVSCRGGKPQDRPDRRAHAAGLLKLTDRVARGRRQRFRPRTRKAPAAPGPEIRITATPPRPGGVAGAKIVRRMERPLPASATGGQIPSGQSSSPPVRPPPPRPPPPEAPPPEPPPAIWDQNIFCICSQFWRPSGSQVRTMASGSMAWR